MRQLLLDWIDAAQKRRDWPTVPVGFQRDAVNAVRERLRPHFRGRGNQLIKARVCLAKAFTWDMLRNAVALLGD